MKIHHLHGYIQSIYLVEYPDKLLLLDGCCRADVSLLRRFITKDLSRPLRDLKIIVVTHMHPDHAGAAHKLRKLTGAKIVSANKSNQWYGGIEGLTMHLTDLLLTFWVASRMSKPKRNIWYSRKLKPDYKLNDHDHLPGFDDWCVLETPGHTDRDLTVLHKPSGKAYVADVVLKVRNRFISPFPIFHPNKYRKSLQRYIDLGTNQMLLAHGGEVSITKEDIERLIRRAPKKPKTHWRAARAKVRRLTRIV